ncbi:MAG: RNaseH domain-containing protein [Crocosphaera sp.]|nr:RNaseH domain-containing protein [Crocosphaera sp.]
MPKKNNSNVALPARMNLAENAFSDLKIAVLMFPFSQEVQNFCDNIQQALRSKKKIYAPYRQLNNALLACSSTLTYGFEWLETIDYIPKYQALAVGKAEEISDKVPKEDKIHQLILAWADTWTKQFLNKKKGNKDEKDEIETVCDRFLDTIDNIPEDWEWEDIEPTRLIEDITSNNSLGYQAIPSLLATLLHEQTITIQLKDREQKITWRKVQGDGSSRTGLHLVSYPFKANYIEEKEDNYQEKEGYWAYKLDFHAQTQAGRFNNKGHLKPWIFLHLSCQRYAHEPLVSANHGRDISILMGMKTARINNYPIDSTLVKLTVENDDKKLWQEQLPELLAAFKARPLSTPQDILDNPVEYGNLDNTENWNKDEYYIINTEGYKYKEEGQKGGGHGHHIKTGFSLKERADLTSKVLQFLDGVLIPDKAMECDIKVPTGKKIPLAIRDYEFFRESCLTQTGLKRNKKFTEIEQREFIKEQQSIIADAIKRSSKNNQIYLFIIYQEEHTKKLVYQQLRESLLLQENDEFPEYLIIEDVLIKDETLLDRIPVTGLASVNKNFDKEIKKGHTKRRQAWQKFLQNNLIDKVKNKNTVNISAIIEIKRFQKTKGIDPRQNNIHAVVREACVLENINSQMLQTIEPTKNDDTVYSPKTKGRTLNAVLDITLRQTGTLYGLPSEVYQIAKIPENLVSKLDVITFCRIKRNNFIGNKPLQYAIAVRLSAAGTVDVLIPNNKKWIPYSKAGIEIGKLFHKARKKDSKSIERLQMKGGDLVKFVADTLVNYLENPTIAIIEADVWRNKRSKEGNNNQAWFQLQNENLLERRDILNFSHVLGHNCQYKRNDERLKNLLSVIRLRSGNETPQYATNRQEWNEDSETKDFTQLSGFIDETVPELLHYFSIGRIPETQKKKQNTPKARNLGKIEKEGDIHAANIAYKHQQMMEMLPFFVRNDLQTEETIKALCRAVHYLRTSPAFTKGNISHPYPMHIGNNLIEDMLCILGFDC